MSTKEKSTSASSKAYASSTATMVEMQPEIQASFCEPAEPMQEMEEPTEADAEMYVRPFDHLSNPQGYSVFEPF